MSSAPINKYKIRMFLYLSVITVSLGASFIIFISVIRPVFIERLQYYGAKTATEAINSAIYEVFSQKNENFNNLVELDKDTEGAISALTTNTIEMNKLRAEISNTLEEKLKDIDEEYIKIPLGNILGNDIFSGLGPDISIKIRPLGLAHVDFYDNFEACGINQSRHTVYISAKVDISVITTSTKTSKQVFSKIPVAETVIVGAVPKFYGAGSISNTILEE